jgi:hypothetical protein
MRSGMYKPPLGARPLRTAYSITCRKSKSSELRTGGRKSIDLFKGEEMIPASSRKILHRLTMRCYSCDRKILAEYEYVSPVAEL